MLIPCMTIVFLLTFLLAWNAGTCIVMMWIAVGCLIQFVNSVVWNGNTINHAPVWCNICKLLKLSVIGEIQISGIATQFSYGANVALPAGALCITRRLYHISHLTNVRITNTEVCSLFHVGP